MFSKVAAVSQSATARRLSAAAVLSAAVFAATACAAQAPGATSAQAVNAKAVAVKPAGTTAGTTAAAPAGIAVAAVASSPKSTPVSYTAGLALISNGTASVKVGTHTVTFPTTVTGATWSPDGSRIAFINAQDNVATARPDGTNLIELTKTNPKVTRSHPTWTGTGVAFTEKTAAGFGTLEFVATPVTIGQTAGTEQALYAGVDAQGDPTTNNSGPSAQYSHTADELGAGDEKLAYQHAGSDGPEVWIVDYTQRESGGWKEVDGTDPAISPDGSKVAFVDPAGQIEVAAVSYVDAQDPAHPAQVTFGANAPANLVWTQDGTHVAYSQAGGVYSVPATPSGHGANPATLVSAATGTVSFLPAGAADQIAQFTGTDPVGLAISASEDRWQTVTQYEPSQGSVTAQVAYIGSSTDLKTDSALMPAVSAGPLLLTDGGTLDPRTAAELRRTLGTATPGTEPTIYLLGNTTRISAAVEQAITQMGYQTQRITTQQTEPVDPGNGAETSRYVSFVAVDQNNILDDLIGTAFAGSYHAPVVQVGDSSTLPTSAAAWIAQAGGSNLNTVVFVPGSANTPLADAIAGIEGSPFGEGLVNNPAKPFGNL